MTTRRRFLRGSGAALALPLLPELVRGASLETPPRVVFWTWPEGVIDDAWWPVAAHGAALADPSIKLPHSSSPLERHRRDLVFVRGFEQRKRGRFEVAHGVANTEILTGRVGGGTSVDQVMARLIAGDAPRRSYELGVAVFGDGLDKLYISQDRAGAQRPTQNNPVKAFDDLVAPSGSDQEARRRRLERLALRKSVLDSMRADAESLRCRLGRDGRLKLDAHLEGVRALERTIDRSMALPAGMASAALVDRSLDTAWRDRSRHAALGKAQIDVMVAAMRADATRVLLMQWSHTNDNGLSFPWMDITYKAASHHALSHEHQGFGAQQTGADKATTRRDRAIIIEWWTKQLAYFVDELKQIPDGAGTLFDSTLIVGFSEHGSNQHRNTDLPFFLLGSAGRRFTTGRAFNYRQPAFRSHNDFLATLVRGFDPAATAFGDAEQNQGVLAELLTR